MRVGLQLVPSKFHTAGLLPSGALVATTTSLVDRAAIDHTLLPKVGLPSRENMPWPSRFQMAGMNAGQVEVAHSFDAAQGRGLHVGGRRSVDRGPTSADEVPQLVTAVGPGLLAVGGDERAGGEQQVQLLVIQRVPPLGRRVILVDAALAAEHHEAA